MVLHNGEERVKRIFRDQLAELAGLLEVGISLLVVVALMLAVVPLIKMFSDTPVLLVACIIADNRCRVLHKILWQYRIILSADTASEVRQMLSQNAR